MAMREISNPSIKAICSYRSLHKPPAKTGCPYNTDPCETMSNATQNTDNTGTSRRRRSRGGQNRRNNDNSENKIQNPQNRREGSYSSQKTGNRKPRHRKLPKRAPLTWWQRLLKAVGLYKEPVRPPRPERKNNASPADDPKKSKVRDARSAQSTGTREGQPSGQRAPRGDGKSNRFRGGDLSTVENRRVYIGNLSYDATETDLEELFKGVGAVRKVEIVYNRNTHRSKGYGFVEMLDIDEAKRTVEVLHDQFFMGRKITVSGAKSQDHRDAEDSEPTNTATIIPALAPLPAVKIEPKTEEIVAEITSEQGTIVEEVVDLIAKEEVKEETVKAEPEVSA